MTRISTEDRKALQDIVDEFDLGFYWVPPQATGKAHHSKSPAEVARIAQRVIRDVSIELRNDLLGDAFAENLLELAEYAVETINGMPARFNAAFCTYLSEYVMAFLASLMWDGVIDAAGTTNQGDAA